MDSDRGAQYLHAGSAGLLKDVLLVLREAQGASPSSQDTFPSRGELAHVAIKHMDVITTLARIIFLLFQPQGIL